jgi:hypothetical protein
VEDSERWIVLALQKIGEEERKYDWVLCKNLVGIRIIPEIRVSPVRISAEKGIFKRVLASLVFCSAGVPRSSSIVTSP